MRTLWLITLFSTLIACVACSRSGAGSALAQAGPAPVTVSVTKAQQRDLVDRIDLTGSLTADEQVTVYAKIPGYLKAIHFDIGDRVGQGQLIAELEIPEMTAGLAEKRAALVKARAALEQARAAVEESRAEAEFAQINYQRLKNIHDRDADVLPGQDVDQARAGHGVASGKLKNAEAQVKVAEAAVTGADAEINTLQTMMAYARIEAPMAGIITQRFVDAGALIQSASSSRTQAAPVVTIARVDRVRAIVDVPESSASYVRPGTAAALQVESTPVPARVSRTGGMLDPASRTLRVEIDVPNGSGRLRPGMTVKVSLDLRKFPGSVTVPIAAVRGLASERSVFIVQDGKAKQLKVKVGLESPDWIQIVDGLRGGEDVIVASAGPLSDGNPVSVRP
ncbi:MAG: efflux RND transporter periplasmic adaptor subunit [Bryobacteraceae bacterium]